MSITLNSDMGEAFGIHTFGNDTALLDYVDTINVACGMHSGDPSTMAHTVTAALDANVTIGAHPGLPDPVGFGRREMMLTANEIRDLIRYQVGALTAFLDAAGAPLHHIKPHGALYGMLSRSEELMESVCDVAEQYGVPILGLPHTAHQRVADRRGVEFVAEFYVDLDYNDDGTIIVNRTATPHDLVHIEAKARRALVDGKTISIHGTEIDVTVESLCIHSDLRNAPDVAARLRTMVDQHAGIT
ncbi:MAG: 5-oxoprolinase subunit PxpA [Rhodococcus sp. (in: high G+C Gram-positive bacteria)]|nr:MAG: 5-oxoprolinase subunit PxpA [Rhodococcus sp. (in: high G+C Gram-positive bacteria)]